MWKGICKRTEGRNEIFSPMRSVCGTGRPSGAGEGARLCRIKNSRNVGKGNFGNSLQTWLVSILIVLAAVVVVKLLSLLGKKVVRPFIGRTKNRLDDVIYSALEAPLKFAVVLLGIWIALHRLVYPDGVVRVVDNAYRILIVLDITWVFARLSSGLLQNYLGRSSGGAYRMLPVVRRTILVLVWIIGIVTALSNVGVDINALLGTLGIGGIAFALAAQDTVKNVFGAFTIFTDKPFAIGDTINVNGLEGTVVDVGMRSTQILGYDRRITSYPNYKITDSSIVNIFVRTHAPGIGQAGADLRHGRR